MSVTSVKILSGAWNTIEIFTVEMVVHIFFIW